MVLTGVARAHLAHLKVSSFTVCVFDSKMSNLTFHSKGFFRKETISIQRRSNTLTHTHTNECIFNNAIECVHGKWRFENRFRISTWINDVKESVSLSEVNMQSFMDQLCERHWCGQSVIDGRRRKNVALHKVSPKFLCAHRISSIFKWKFINRNLD